MMKCTRSFTNFKSVETTKKRYEFLGILIFFSNFQPSYMTKEKHNRNTKVTTYFLFDKINIIIVVSIYHNIWSRNITDMPCTILKINLQHQWCIISGVMVRNRIMQYGRNACYIA